MAERPGVMIYFDMAEPLKVLGYEDKGRLLDAILDYGQFGIVPEFEGILTVVWGFMRPRLDADAKSYRKKVVKNTYSSFCAKEKKAGKIPMEMDEWLEREGIDSEWHRTVSVDANRLPTSTPKTKTLPTSKSMAKTKSETDGGGNGEEDFQEDESSMRRRKMAMLANYQPD